MGIMSREEIYVFQKLLEISRPITLGVIKSSLNYLNWISYIVTIMTLAEQKLNISFSQTASEKWTERTSVFIHTCMAAHLFTPDMMLRYLCKYRVQVSIPCGSTSTTWLYLLALSYFSPPVNLVQMVHRHQKGVISNVRVNICHMSVRLSVCEMCGISITNNISVQVWVFRRCVRVCVCVWGGGCLLYTSPSPRTA